MKRKRDLAITFCIMFPFWLVLSGRFDLFHVTLGVISCGIVASFSGDLLVSAIGGGSLPKVARGFLRYIPWLLLQIFLSSLHMLRLSLHPRMRELIDPRIITFKSGLKDELALVTFANSITLTPGTITVFVDLDGEFRVHAIDSKCAEALPGEMEQRVEAIFGEK
ncbi:MAG: Na+/H+ antiporter subunit E [bacterium]